MMWIVLGASGVLEAVWASALPSTEGFKRPIPTTVFILAATLSMIGLSWAMTEISTGTAYAVWVGIGAVLTLGYSVSRRKEVLSTSGALLMLCLLVSVIGLRVVS
jgi:quaternary ammonium compound-resistance protein SugE